MFDALIVEDEPLMRNYLADNLTRIHPEWRASQSCRDGLEAMDILKREKFNLVITDIKMPSMDGLELSQYIHERYPDTKVIILTGYNEFDYARTAVRNGVVDYLLKPLEDRELTEALNRISPTTYEFKDRIIQMETSDDEDNPLIIRVRMYIQKHFHEPLSLTDLADIFDVSTSYLSSVFKSDRGESFTKFLMRLRMEKAAELLVINKVGKITDIAEEAGFSSVKYFDHSFKKYFGVTPNEYRESH